MSPNINYNKLQINTVSKIQQLDNLYSLISRYTPISEQDGIHH